MKRNISRIVYISLLAVAVAGLLPLRAWIGPGIVRAGTNSKVAFSPSRVKSTAPRLTQTIENGRSDTIPANKPGEKLYSIGGRPQRVRFLLATHGQTFDQVQQILGPEGSASIRKLIQDPIQSLPNQPQGKYIRQAKPPAAPGVELDAFAEGNNIFGGEVINPGLVMCNANLLDLVKAAGDQNPSLFNDRSINEINLFLRVVPSPTGEDTLRVGIGPAAVDQPGSALNVLVEYLPLELKCSLPTLQELEDRLANPE